MTAVCLAMPAAGGNAHVYLYEQDLPRRKVAVKVLNESGLTEDARRRFRGTGIAQLRLQRN